MEMNFSSDLEIIFLFVLIIFGYLFVGYWQYKNLRADNRSCPISFVGGLFWIFWFAIAYFIIFLAFIFKIDLDETDNTGGT
jgi:hypothetical protein